jgi:hypothetical protein
LLDKYNSVIRFYDFTVVDYCLAYLIGIVSSITIGSAIPATSTLMASGARDEIITGSAKGT